MGNTIQHHDFAAGDAELLPHAEAALRQVNTCNVLVNDLHSSNIVITHHTDRLQIFFVDFSLAQTHPSAEQCLEELHILRLLFEGDNDTVH